MDLRPVVLVSLACRMQAVPLSVLARALGVARRTLQRWDAGNPPPHGAALLLLRVLAETPPADLPGDLHDALRDARRKVGRPVKTA